MVGVEGSSRTAKFCNSAGRSFVPGERCSFSFDAGLELGDLTNVLIGHNVDVDDVDQRSRLVLRGVEAPPRACFGRTNCASERIAYSPW